MAGAKQVAETVTESRTLIYHIVPERPVRASPYRENKNSLGSSFASRPCPKRLAASARLNQNAWQPSRDIEPT
jgi:hypothetical protein